MDKEIGYDIIKEITLEKMKFVVQSCIDGEYISEIKNIKTDVRIDKVTKDMYLRLTGHVFGKQIPKIKYPLTWKDSVKEAFYNWVEHKISGISLDKKVKVKLRAILFYLKSKTKNKHPVKYKEIDIKVLYPDLYSMNGRIAYTSSERNS